MKAPPRHRYVLLAVAVAVVVVVVSLASCQNIQRLRPPFHEPAVTPASAS